MSLLEKLRRPATSSNHRRHSSITEPEKQHTKSSSRSGRGHQKIGSLQRLSLSLSNSDANVFGSFLTQEPDEIQRTQTAEDRASNIGRGRSSRTSPTRSNRNSQLISASNPENNEVPKLPNPGQQRFSLLKFKHASDPQLSTKYKTVAEASEDTATPKIITTAPTSQLLDEPAKKKSKTMFGRSFSPFRKSQVFRSQDIAKTDVGEAGSEIDAITRSTPDLHEQRIHFEDHVQKDNRHLNTGPPAYGDESTSSLAIPISRLSESGGSEGSSGSHNLYARTTTTHTISTTTTFFKLKRKKKDKGPLFPLPERFVRPTSQRANTTQTLEHGTPRRSMSPRRSMQAVRFESLDGDHVSPIPSPSHSMTAITNAPLGSPGPAIVRKHSTLSNRSSISSPSFTMLPPRLGARDRSSTMGSLGKSSDRGDQSLQLPDGRTSTSTNGRRSFGDILTFSHRLRQNSGPPRNSSNNSPSTPGSKSNSMQLARETEPELVYPPKADGDTPATYLEKLEAAVARGQLATILCKSGDEFAKTCLRKYMRGFSYFQESIDMSIRKMLMEVELPKETQQIDRLLAAFADRYHECNPGIFKNSDEASIIAFSILLLHSDNHNKNNKRKMQKQDYVKNTQHGQIHVSSDILECFYDNICYTPFIHFDDDVAVNSHRLTAPKTKKSLIRTKSSESLRGPVDPYTLILDNKLELLRPPLKDVMDTEDTYSSTGTLKNPNPNDHHRAFMQSAVLQIVSARSRPDAFMTQATISNPAEASAGLVSIKIAKVGLLWRKDPKKKKAKRPWQEWGAVLTDSKLYFFKDVGWVKKLIGQYEGHTKTSHRNSALIFKPPLTSFEPDALMAMDDAVAIMDSSYKKHKNAFTFIKHGGFEEVFLANSESEMNDWIGKLNYAATFRTVGVRMRGLLGSNYEGRRLFRKGSETSAMSAEQMTEQSPSASKVDPQTAWEILFYRHQLIQEKISGFEDKLSTIRAELDSVIRDARHLLLLLPIQSKTREALVLAAGRMSAKLKWARVEMYRTQTHTDVLRKDLEAEGNVSSFPAPHRGSVATVPFRINPQLNGQPNIHKDENNNISESTLSPVTPTAPTIRRPSQTILDQITIPGNTPDHRVVPHSPHGSPTFAPDPFTSKQESRSESGTLHHQSSIVSSLRSRQDHDWHVIKNDTDEDEERALREAGLIGIDGEVNKDKDKPRRGSESEKDRLGAVSPASDGTPKDRGSSVRRSLQRTLREVHHPSPNHRRKGKESGSSNATVAEETLEPPLNESIELKRGAGSFILHGKKASVITMSPEWASMSNEERMKKRKAEATGAKGFAEAESLNEEAIDDAVAPEPSGLSALSSPVREDFVSASSSRRMSVSTANEGYGEDDSTFVI